MITNDRQYKITKAQAQNLANAIESFDEKSEEFEEVDPRLIKAQYAAIKLQLQDLRVQIREYEEIKSGKFSYVEVDDIDDLPIALIKARIAEGLTQAELAQKLGMPEQQIQRYESQKYSTASLERLKEVAKTLGLKIKVTRA